MQGMRIKGGVSLFQKEIPLPYTHPEKIYIAGFKLEGLHALRNWVQCTWLRHGLLRLRYHAQPRPTPWGASDGSPAADCAQALHNKKNDR